MSNYFSMETDQKDRQILILSAENYYCSRYGEGSQVLCKHPIGWSEIPKCRGSVQKEQLND